MGFAPSDLTLTSSAFADRSPIPIRHTAYGDNISPAFSWSSVPEGTRSFALVCHDPDAPMVTPTGEYGFVHWVLYNIPGQVTELAEGVDPGTYTTGPNQLGESSYFGPQPPPGHGLHAYYFWLLALRCEPEVEAGLDLWKLLEAVEGDLIGMNRLVGTYEQPAT
jgi:Raf kinase inhibitor-like YbhB/YbcL family protein